MVNSRRKGKDGELEWAAKLRELGFLGARRGVQFHGLEGEDVVKGIPGTHCEVKRTESINVYKAMDQAVNDVGLRPKIPYVAHRRSRRRWLVIIEAEDLLAFAEAVYKSRTPEER